MTPITPEEIKLKAIRSLNKPLEEERVKNTYTFKELHDRKDEEQKFIIPELLPAGTVTVLLGEDGIGKTQLCSQLCLSIAMKHTKFLGMDLYTKLHDCLITATEDSRQKFTKAIMKIAKAMDPEYKPEEIGIKFTEGANFDSLEDFMAEVELHLKKKTTCLWVLDAFSDMFTFIDGDINSNMNARYLLSIMQRMTSKYEGLSILIVHHAAKTKMVPKHKEGKIFLEKNDSQGAGAITQKSRTVLGLSTDPASGTPDGESYTNYLHVVKANLMGKFYVNNAIELKFSLSTLMHKATGLVDVATRTREGEAKAGPQVVNKPKPKPTDYSEKEHRDLCKLIFSESEAWDRNSLVEKIKVHYGVGKTKVEESKGFLNYLLENAYICKDGNVYKLKTKPIGGWTPVDE